MATGDALRGHATPSATSETTAQASEGRAGAGRPQNGGSGAPGGTAGPRTARGGRSHARRRGGGGAIARANTTGAAGDCNSVCSGWASPDQPTLSQPAAMQPTGPQTRSCRAPGGAVGAGTSTPLVHVIPPSVVSKARREAVHPNAQRPEATGAPASRMYSPPPPPPPSPTSGPTTAPPASTPSPLT